MRTLGLIGGLSWESTREYYRILNEGIRNRLGGLHSAPLLISSLNFSPVAALQHENRWEELDTLMVSHANSLVTAGAEGIGISSNLMHRTAPAISKSISVPLLHIADSVASYAIRFGALKLGLLGAVPTMEEQFYINHLLDAGIEDVLIPEKEDRDFVQHLIYKELCQGIINPSSKLKLKHVVETLQSRGAQGVALACTELPLILQQQDVGLPILDTVALHCESLLDWMVSAGTKEEHGGGEFRSSFYGRASGTETI